MRHNLRSHLTFANVVSLAALFVALGGTAMAAAIITDNSQVAKNTISGHKPPAGDHSNIIGGSVNGQDVANNSLTGADINEFSLARNARKLIYTADAANPPATTDLGKIGPYTLKGSCLDLGGGITRFTLFAQGPAGTAHVMYHEVADNDPSKYQTLTYNDVTIPASTDTQIARTVDVQDHYVGIAGTAMLNTGSTVVEVDFNAQANSPYLQTSPPNCFLYGTATNAS
jgi:hypothetical protein